MKFKRIISESDKIINVANFTYWWHTHSFSHAETEGLALPQEASRGPLSITPAVGFLGGKSKVACPVFQALARGGRNAS